MDLSFFRPAVRVVLAWLAIASVHAAGDDAPLWAYGFTVPAAPGQRAKLPIPGPVGLRPGQNLVEQTRPLQAEGSTRTFSRVELRNRRDVADWFPEEHPPMPAVVRHGSAGLGPGAYACAQCHLPQGKGRPDNAPISGLAPAYFMRQLHDFRQGLRHSSEPRKANSLLMIALAQAMTEEEIQAAAQYYGRLPATPWIRVVETDYVPRTRITGSGVFMTTERAFTEPIGRRIIETPECVEQFELANPHSGVVAYVPVGSIARGETLVTTGGASVIGGATIAGKTVACATCHGPELKGLNDAPRIAGRSPSYLVRQMWDIKQGTRKSPLSLLMLPVVANLTADDLVAIAAYVSSRQGE